VGLPRLTGFEDRLGHRAPPLRVKSSQAYLDITDAHPAALAIEHGATLASSDRDFGRFPRLRWIDPLAD
jgi:predicted nucleic acid-binding protein